MRRREGVEDLGEFTQEVRRLVSGFTRAERVIAAGCAVMAVALFLDWTTVSCTRSPVCSVLGIGSEGIHGWAWLTFMGFVGAVGLLVVRRLLSPAIRQPRFAVPDPFLYMAFGVLELAGCFLYWLDNPYVAVGPTTISYGPGWYLGLIAAGLTVAGGQLYRRRWPEQLDLFDRTGVNDNLYQDSGVPQGTPVMPPSPAYGTVVPSTEVTGRRSGRGGRTAGGRRAGG